MAKAPRPTMPDLLSPRFFKALGDPTRLAILRWLTELGKECTVSQIAGSCTVGISAVSRHLALLRDCGILACERRGQEVYYRVKAGDVAGLLRQLANALDGR